MKSGFCGSSCVGSQSKDEMQLVLSATGLLGLKENVSLKQAVMEITNKILGKKTKFLRIKKIRYNEEKMYKSASRHYQHEISKKNSRKSIRDQQKLFWWKTV